jgi:hypothetical protein
VTLKRHSGSIESSVSSHIAITAIASAGGLVVSVSYYSIFAHPAADMSRLGSLEDIALVLYKCISSAGALKIVVCSYAAALALNLSRSMVHLVLMWSSSRSVLVIKAFVVKHVDSGPCFPRRFR